VGSSFSRAFAVHGEIMSLLIISVFMYFCVVVVANLSNLSFELIKTLMVESQSNQICFIGKVTDQDISILSLFSNNVSVCVNPGNLLGNCQITQNVLILMNESEIEYIQEILENMSQAQLRSNLWMMLFSNNLTSIQISTTEKKIGLRAQIYCLALLDQVIHLTQHLGTGSSNLQEKVKVHLKKNSKHYIQPFGMLQEHGPLASVNLTDIIAKTRQRNDFQGFTFSVQFGHFPPYCVVKDEGDDTLIFSGIIVELFEAFAFAVNLTVPKSLAREY
jgi:hypothetical protein